MRSSLIGKFLGALLMAGLALGSNHANAQKMERLTVPITDSLPILAVYVARGGNFFAKENIEPDWVNLASGPKQVASLVGGSSDMLATSLIQVIKARAQGNDVVVLGSIFNVYAVKVALTNEAIARTGITAEMSIDEKVKRMQGLKIGISSAGSSTDALVRSLYLARGYDPDKAISFIPHGNGAALLAAIEKKLIDGLAWPSPVPEMVEFRKLGKIVIDPFTREVPELNDQPFVVLATSRAAIEKKPELIKGALRAVEQGMAYAATAPEESCAMVRKSFPDIDEPVFKATCEAHRKVTPHKLAFTREQLEKTLTWMNLGSKDPVSAKFEDISATVDH